MVKRHTVQTHSREELVDVTSTVAEMLAASEVSSGVVTLFVPHTTAGITINENADPDVGADVLKGLAHFVPQRLPLFRHAEGNSDAHIKASLVGSSVQVIVENGHLLLGTWQAVYFCEFDGPRSRRLWVKIAPDADT